VTAHQSEVCNLVWMICRLIFYTMIKLQYVKAGSHISYFILAYQPIQPTYFFFFLFEHNFFFDK
jgi:hypothetical protein